MRAIDTNVIVRLLTADDPVQAEAAKQIIQEGDVFIGVTVLLEVEWVLRAAYGFGANEIAAAIRGLAGLPQVTVEEAEAVAKALDWTAKGMDFADALHLARAQHCSAFVTFDRKLASKAKGFAQVPVIAL
ncbi:MAG: VapC toxin family PIN domain ribonuclease [Novosphingobium sp. 32-60-15]|uniref:type II toxin-antitoxin system VapC family toxin n=1 Tax=unclassified Novosphingobium TaxID=2644732 RepID=UPI000BCA2379|nr:MULTISPECIES: type II toxin-antitoxin system VapC family toxin [unclassified Novosphingobium]OYX61374.1 MAG: VapC toxin family PIN domain ribonuclease [Novosphingobium sp. 32-60-15]